MTDNGGFGPFHPPPRAMIDRTASDLADVRMERRRETRLRLVEAIAASFLGVRSDNSIEATTALFREIVNALESIVEPTDDCGGTA